MKYYYVAVLTPRGDGTGFDCAVPDLPHCITSGADLPEALKMIEDAAGLMLVGYEDLETPIPQASDPVTFQSQPGTITTLLSLDTDMYRQMNDTTPIRKSVSIPAWMDRLVKQQGISCSQVLQEALRQRLVKAQ
ncbi:MAG: type II toxin-antitoxin system HicB family antitoxin [Clostridia bacterium]|nr:type II toxin-antitoxin system HicB family antitoxin [Clostridia bacterium]MBR0408289.1 type II toxin-antitoxin system HicB family antitoxin [Clostridia bacterium]